MGWDQFNTLLKSKTQLGDEDDFNMQKTPVTSGALVSAGYYDFYEAADEPAANTLPTGSNAFKLAASTGGVPQLGGTNINALAFSDVGPAKTKHLLYGEAFCNTASGTGDLIVYDFLGAYCDFSIAANTTINTGTGVSTADITRYTSGKRVFAVVVTQVVFAGTQPTIQLAYTDGALTSQTTAALTMIATCPRGRVATTTYYRVPLVTNSGIVAVRSVTFAGGAGATGKVAIFLCRQLGRIKVVNPLELSPKSFSDPRGAFLFPRILDGAVLGFAWRSTNTPTTPRIDATLWTADGAV